MAISPGTRLGPYEVLSAIGAGGMGEVYRARDTRLNRDVALKVLPEAFSRDTQRMARFEREAKLLASLNHTNIAAIYGLEESGGVRALVMELVEGPTLADRIAAGPIPIDEALPIAKQIAEAVEYAHEQNVIHRDLKPANIKVKEDGIVKVLDFGLAKAMSDEVSDTDLSNSPTLSMAATRAGIILGTAAYMSPEQARGKRVDRRTDIWAFGVVLYEMLTGRQTFGDEDVSMTLSKVLQREPDFDALPQNIPAKVRQLLKLCLRKDPKQRVGDFRDVRLAMEGAFETPTASDGKVATTPTKSRERLVLGSALAVAVVALGALSSLHFREAPSAVLSEMRTEIVTPSTTELVSFALSPDGRQIVFVASGDGPSRLWLRRLETTAAQPLPGTEGATYPFWSSDSRSIGFFADTKLRRIDIGGGLPQTLDSNTFGRGGTWSVDGTILYAPNSGTALFRIPASGGQRVAVTKLDKGIGGHRFPQFLPGGRQFLFYALGTPETAGIYLGSLDSSETKRLTAADSTGEYLTSGWLLFIRSGTLVARKLDLARKELTGDPVTLADPVAFDSTAVAGAFSVSPAGLVAYRSGAAGLTQLAWFDRSGKSLGYMGRPDGNGLADPRLSPDGLRAAVVRTIEGNEDVWLIDGAHTTRFTFDPGLDRDPVWSPDGARIAFDSRRGNHYDLYVKSSNGAGSEERLLESDQDKGAYDWSRDGRFLVYGSVDPQTSYDLWVLPMEGDRKPFVFLKTNFQERRAQFSPDGHWVAYVSNESGRYEIYVRPFSGTATNPAAGGEYPVSTSGGIDPRWRPDGKELYYISPDGKLMASTVTINNGAFQPGTPVALFQTRIVSGGSGLTQGAWEYAVSADGRFLVNTLLEAANSPITLLQNWNPEAKK
jgi:serine/threonine protein kinase